MGFRANIIGAGHKQLFAALAVAIVVGGCGDGGGAGGTTPAPAPPPPPPNQAPVAVLAIPPQSLTIGTPITLNLAEHFSDPDGDQLTFTATTGSGTPSGTPTAGECVVVNQVISIPEGGSCRISSATVDLYRLSSLGIAPGDAVSCSDGRIRVRGISVGTIRINGLTIQCGSGAPTGAAVGAGEVSVSVSGSVLTLTPVREGNATVEVVATDPGGLTASQSFDVMVEPAGPPLTARLTECSGRVSGGDVHFTMSGSVTANRRITGLVVHGCAAPQGDERETCEVSDFFHYIGNDRLGTLERGDSTSFEVSGESNIPRALWVGERPVCWISLTGSASALAGAVTRPVVGEIDLRSPRN